MSEYTVIWSGTRNGRESGTYSLIGNGHVQKESPVVTKHAPGNGFPAAGEGKGEAGTFMTRTSEMGRAFPRCPCGRTLPTSAYTRKRCWSCLKANRRIRRRAA